MFWSRSLFILCTFFFVQVSSAFLAIEDFEFYEHGTNLTYQSGGNGFLERWGPGELMITTTNFNLEYTATGYNVDSLGVGSVRGDGTGGILTSRLLAAPVYGTPEGKTIWFSSLALSTSGARIGWHFNPTSTTRTSADAGFLFVARKLGILDDTLLIYPENLSSISDGTHLVLGSIILTDSTNSTVRFWIDPADVSSTNALGTADYSFDADFGGSLFSIGVEGYGSPRGFLDAIRISDGNGDPDRAFREVTGKTPNILFGPVDFTSMQEFTNNFALLAATTNDWVSLNDDNYGEGGYLKPYSNIVGSHHTYVIDTDGAAGGCNDVFGQCTIDFDTRSGYIFGIHFYSHYANGANRTKKHWIVSFMGSHQITAYYNRDMSAQTGHIPDTTVSHTVTASDWRHVRMDIRRINSYSEVEARLRIWDNASDFRGTPIFDHTFIYIEEHHHPYSSEIGLSSYITTGSIDTASEFDNVAVYRYGTAPDWFKPKGTLILIQ